MFGIGLPELGVIALVALFLLGPEKLPGLAKQAGAFLRAAKKFSDGARDELRGQLGPEYADLELTDLDPRTLVRKHITEAMRDAEAAEADREADRAADRDDDPDDADEDDDEDDVVDEGPGLLDEDDDEDDIPERLAYRRAQEQLRR